MCARKQEVKTRKSSRSATLAQGQACESDAIQLAKKAKKAVMTQCLEPSSSSRAAKVTSASSASASMLDAARAPSEAAHVDNSKMKKEKLRSRYVCVNHKSKTVHHTVLRNSFVAGCGFFFGNSSSPTLLSKANVDGYFACGACYGERLEIEG